MQNNEKIINRKKKIPSILLIGVGMWGENHLRVWLKLQEEGLCCLVGVQDNNPERLKEISEKFSVRTFLDNSGWKEADAVDIVVPPSIHLKVAKEALIAGKDVLVEKPITKTVGEAQELEKIHKNSSKILMVGHLFRYNPALDYVKKLLEDKEIGDIRFLRGRFGGFRFKEHDAGILTGLSIHFLYISNYLMGEFPKSVNSKVDYLLDSNLEDFSMVRLNYDSGFSIIESDCFTPGKWRTFDIIGTKGSIFVDLLSQKVELHLKKHTYINNRFDVEDRGVLKPEIKFHEPLDLELRHFLECIKTRSEPSTGVKEGIETLKILEAAYESSEQDRTIKLKKDK